MSDTQILRHLDEGDARTATAALLGLFGAEVDVGFGAALCRSVSASP
jgi:hypothetical protein